jgi:hypothetical protein
MRQIGGIVLLADGVCLCALVYFTKQIFPLKISFIQIRTPFLSNAIGYAKFRSRSHQTVIRVYDED